MGVVRIVEDEVLIRMNAVQMVEDAGYAALEAANADDAIEILKRTALVSTPPGAPTSNL